MPERQHHTVPLQDGQNTRDTKNPAVHYTDPRLTLKSVVAVLSSKLTAEGFSKVRESLTTRLTRQRRHEHGGGHAYHRSIFIVACAGLQKYDRGDCCFVACAKTNARSSTRIGSFTVQQVPRTRYQVLHIVGILVM